MSPRVLEPSLPDAPVAILGAGAVGLTLAAFLGDQGFPVCLITRRGEPPPLPIRFTDEINGVERVLDDVATHDLAGLPRAPRHLIVATRGEQLEAALADLRGRLDPAVPVTVAAATLADLVALARDAGLPNPILRMGIAFATWPVGPGRFRVFALHQLGSAISSDSGRDARPGRDELARWVSTAGLPTEAPPTWAFHWLFFTMLAIEVGWMLAYRRAGWEMKRLAADPALLRAAGQAMHEAARLIRPAGGPLAWLAGRLPASLYVRFATHRSRHASEGFCAVWRHHGPKTEAQLDLLAEQLVGRAVASNASALRALLPRGTVH